MKNPYPGLRPFQQDESQLFFGRDGQTDEILARLGHEHFVAIVGVSGCGKSSLINAGVFPGLHGGLLPTGQREWRIARLQPRNQPIRNLATALLDAGACAADESSDPRSLVEGVLHSSTQGLGDLVRGRLSAEGASSCALLIVVDQFEEIFRFSRSSATGEAAQFVQLLLEAIPKKRKLGK
jgi:energy-coupling factor transporter ATP-binding protein EcfA2